MEDKQEQYQLLIESHDQLGHKGFYATQRTLGDCFWWPSINFDVHWIIDTCHQCQIQSLEHIVMPPTVQVPAPLFHKVYIDTMHMPLMLGQFIFEELLCHWGGLEEIVTENGTAFIAALDWIADWYHIHHIRILAYNSQSNSVIETTHRTICDS
ncbi:hypothetical protein AN958_08088 [Leucoagaricus sp. SymC.cos]|nr:hypothetical protein AN958_08088 [Leucoagaricus sp. SymC.cos]